MHKSYQIGDPPCVTKGEKKKKKKKKKRMTEKKKMKGRRRKTIAADKPDHLSCMAVECRKTVQNKIMQSLLYIMQKQNKKSIMPSLWYKYQAITVV